MRPTALGTRALEAVGEVPGERTALAADDAHTAHGRSGAGDGAKGEGRETSRLATADFRCGDHVTDDGMCLADVTRCHSLVVTDHAHDDAPVGHEEEADVTAARHQQGGVRRA